MKATVTLQEIERWATNQPVGAVVGVTEHACECPIAQAIRDLLVVRKPWSVWVTADGCYLHSYQSADLERDVETSDFDPVTLYDLVDALHDTHQEVTREEFLGAIATYRTTYRAQHLEKDRDA